MNYTFRATAMLGREILFKDTTVLRLCEEGGKYKINVMVLPNTHFPILIWLFSKLFSYFDSKRFSPYSP